MVFTFDNEEIKTIIYYYALANFRGINSENFTSDHIQLVISSDDEIEARLKTNEGYLDDTIFKEPLK